MPERTNVRHTGPADRTHNTRRHTREFRWTDMPMWNQPYHGTHHDYARADRNSRMGRHHAED